ncbi:hypothetical protein [Mycolicibacterium sp. S3B2]|uniref:hypothetical protein n=1 Tax=Mycolicibacterium sp. S3B2 TaxID=3415120 RepID=UPI003C7A218F
MPTDAQIALVDLAFRDPAQSLQRQILDYLNGIKTPRMQFRAHLINTLAKYLCTTHCRSLPLLAGLDYP